MSNIYGYGMIDPSASGATLTPISHMAVKGEKTAKDFTKVGTGQAMDQYRYAGSETSSPEYVPPPEVKNDGSNNNGSKTPFYPTTAGGGNPYMQQWMDNASETLQELMARRGQNLQMSSGRQAYGQGMTPYILQAEQLGMQKGAQSFDQMMAMNRLSENQRQFAAMHDLQAQQLGINAANQYNPYGWANFVGDLGGMVTDYYLNKRSREGDTT